MDLETQVQAHGSSNSAVEGGHSEDEGAETDEQTRSKKQCEARNEEQRHQKSAQQRHLLSLAPQHSGLSSLFDSVTHHPILRSQTRVLWNLCWRVNPEPIQVSSFVPKYLRPIEVPFCPI